jgi:hypothetical protein
VAIVLAFLVVSALAACGSSSSGGASAQTLLKQTFSGSHKVDSGVLTFNLTLSPSGSSTLKTPLSVDLSGPFQSRGAGKLPESNFNLALDALGHHGALGIVSTGTSGYVTLQGQAYQLPASDFQRLGSSFSGASGGSSGGLSKLGIDPLHWLTHPSVVGNQTVGGASTTLIRAGVNVPALLTGLSTVLQKASSSGASSAGVPSTLSPAARSAIAAAVKNATVDVWTGSSDKTLRKLSINLQVGVSGRVSSLLGGMTSAGIGMGFQYADLNQPQAVAAPANPLPFTDFAERLHGIVAELESTLGGAGLGSSSGAGSSGSSGSSSSGASKYTTCIQRAAGNAPKMQKCASLLSSTASG